MARWENPTWNEMSPNFGYRFRRGLTDRLDATLHLNYLQTLGSVDLRLAGQLLGGGSTSGLSIKLETGLEVNLLLNDDTSIPLQLSAGLPLGQKQIGVVMGVRAFKNFWVNDDSPFLLTPNFGIGARMPWGRRKLSLRLSYIQSLTPPDGEPGVEQELVDNIAGLLFTEFGVAF